MRAIGTKAQRLLEAARTGDEPSSAQITALGERLFSEIGAGASTGLHVARVSAPSGKGLALSAKWWASGVLGTAGVASVALFVGIMQDEPRRAPPAPVSAPSSSSIATFATQPVDPAANRAPPSAIASASASPSRAAPVRRRAAATPGPGLRVEEESALLAAAQRALSRGELGLALAELDRYDRRFPSGVLRTEAATARVLALCSGAAPKASASKAAERFLARYPHSPARARIARVCGL